MDLEFPPVELQPSAPTLTLASEKYSEKETSSANKPKMGKLKHRDMAWAMHVKSQSDLVTFAVYKNRPESEVMLHWPALAALGVGYWLTDTALLVFTRCLLPGDVSFSLFHRSLFPLRREN
jgi:hypothetical protein